MEMIKNKRVLALVGILCLFIGTFLPYITINIWGYKSSLSLWQYWEGKVILVLTFANALFIFKDYVEKYVPQLFKSDLGKKIYNANSKMSLVPTGLVVAFTVYLNTKLDISSSYINNGLGFYLLWVGVICLIGHVVLYKKQNEVVQTVQSQATIQPEVAQPVQSTEQMVQQPTVETQNKKYCPYCRNQVDADATMCFMCGSKF